MRSRAPIRRSLGEGGKRASYLRPQFLLMYKIFFLIFHFSFLIVFT